MRPTLSSLAAAVAIAAALAAPALTMAQPTCQPQWTGFSNTQAFNDTVYDMVVFDEKLVARGSFSTAGGAPISRTAMWDGQAWSPMPGSAAVEPGDFGGTLAPLRGSLYAVGALGNINDSPPKAGWVWNRAQWTTIPTTGLFSGHTWRATAGKRVIFASGSLRFQLPGGSTIDRSVARFDGTQWDRMGNQRGPVVSAPQSIDALILYNGALFVAGQFTSVDLSENGTNLVTVSNICRWDGTTWSPVGPGFNARVRALAVHEGSLYAGGDFSALGDGTMMRNIARWDGAAWHTVGQGVGMSVFRLASVDDGRGTALFVAGDGAQGATAYNPDGSQVNFITIVRWRNNAWSPLGGGISVSPTAIVPFEAGDGPAAYMAGPFIRVDGVPNSALGRFARWGPAPLVDTDGDGIYDLWETQGIDADCDGIIDLVLNTNPNHKDVLVEVDAMAGYAPTPGALDRVRLAFNAAPGALVNNPDGFDGIDLFIHLDETNLTNYVFPNAFRDFNIVKADHFGTAAQRASPNWDNIREAKRRVYRYCIFGISYGTTSSGGLAEFEGNDFMVTLGLWTPPGGTEDQQAGTFMHELGHTLGLDHGGHQIDFASDARFNYKPNYRSVMNYSFQFPRSGVNATWALDFSRAALPSLNEAALVETVPIAPGATWLTLVGPVPGLAIPAAAAWDFDRDGTFDPAPVAADLNRLFASDPATPGDTLEGSEDWSRLRYSFRNSAAYADGAEAPDTDGIEMTHETYLAIQAIPSGGPAPCPADWNDDTLVNSNDISAFLTDWLADVQGSTTLADFDASGQTNSNDISAFLTAWLDAVQNGC